MTPHDYRLYERIYQVVAQIPRGAVASYGDIASVVGGGCDARTVGYALGELPPDRAALVPWQRVVNREGGISTRGLLQRDMLEQEGVAFDAQGHALLPQHRWRGPDPAWAAQHGFQTLPEREEGQQLSLF